MKKCLLIFLIILVTAGPVFCGEFEDTLKKAEQGDADAQSNLGFMYAKGQGVPQNNKKAAYWFTKAAEQGDASAQYNLGVMYDNGQGVHHDYKQAVYWWTMAAEQGDASAQFNLGRIYHNREVYPKN